MGKLQVIFELGLAHPLSLFEGIPDHPATVHFADTGNTVSIDPPKPGTRKSDPGTLGAFEVLILRVQRDCSDTEGKDTTYINNERLSINKDAGRAFWRLFETVRNVELRHRHVAGYPVVPAETIQSNPLVRKCKAEWIYDGVRIQQMTFGGIASVGIGYVLGEARFREFPKTQT